MVLSYWHVSVDLIMSVDMAVRWIVVMYGFNVLQLQNCVDQHVYVMSVLCI